MLVRGTDDGAPVMFSENAMRSALNVDDELESPEPRLMHAKKYRIVR